MKSYSSSQIGFAEASKVQSIIPCPRMLFRPVDTILECKNFENVVASNLNLIKFCRDNILKLDLPTNLAVFKRQCTIYLSLLKAHLSEMKTGAIAENVETLTTVFKMLESIFDDLATADHSIDVNVILMHS